METPDGKLQTITVPAGNFAVSKRPSPRSGGGAARGKKRPAAVMMGGSAAPPQQHQQQADRSLYSLVSSVVSSKQMANVFCVINRECSNYYEKPEPSLC
jgi:hypothetical protein